MKNVSLVSLFICLLSISHASFTANLLVSEETGRLLAELVRASAEYDLYNARCRGNAASTKTEDSNRLLLAKYRLTVNQVITNFIGRDDRAERAAMEQLFLQKLNQLGGCAEAKKRGLQRELDQKYRQLFEQISDLP